MANDKNDPTTSNKLPDLDEPVREVRPDEVLRSKRSTGRLEIKSSLRSGIPDRP